MMHERITPVADHDETREYEHFCRAIRMHTGLDLDAYKRRQMERRIRAMAERAGSRDLYAFWRLLAGKRELLNEFLDRVTINVSGLFRNPEKFAELQRDILPELLRRRQSLFVWSAGCSYGAEAYSLRILLHQLCPGAAHRLLATDIDGRMLERARRGIFSAEDLAKVPEELCRRYLTLTGQGYAVADCLRDIEFAPHDLLRDPFPVDVDLILCRNVMIYFTDEAKSRLFARFHAALRPDGYLLIGSTERMPDARALGFVSTRPFLYQKQAERAGDMECSPGAQPVGRRNTDGTHSYRR